MCDMQKMPSTDDATCDEDSEMNFAAFQAVSSAGSHFVTTNGQLPATITKIQQNVTSNGSGMPQVVSMVSNLGEGMQYVRTIDSSGNVSAPQLISVPIALPNTKAGDPQPTVQIQVLNPNMLQQQPKYQMQIPIQGFQQGGAVLTLAYSPEGNDGNGIQILGNSLTEGVQVVAALPPEMHLLQQQDTKQHLHQVFITPDQQIVINGADQKPFNNNNNNETSEIVIKEECDETPMDDESSQGTEASDCSTWQISAAGRQDLVKYLSQLPPHQTQALPASLQQFLRMNPSDGAKKEEKWPQMEVEVTRVDQQEPVAEAVLGEDGSVLISTKKKKKYKKKPPKPARPKPGQVVIATASDGTLIFCCPECQMAYPDKEQLETHLVIHKIERRFICGICGAGLKRKEHLERHKLGHNPERPYVCGVCGKGFKRREHLNLHVVIHSGVKTEMCTECGKGFYRKDHLRKHTRSHESKRARDEASSDRTLDSKLTEQLNTAEHENVNLNLPQGNNVMPEITIHIPLDDLDIKHEVPTSEDTQVPVQINIPAHLMTSLSRGHMIQDSTLPSS